MPPPPNPPSPNPGPYILCPTFWLNSGVSVNGKWPLSERKALLKPTQLAHDEVLVRQLTVDGHWRATDSSCSSTDDF